MKKKMSNYVNNLNELINTKKELKDIIIESTGENPSEVFSYYPSYIRNAIASSSASEEAVNSYISAYLSAYNYIDQDTLSSNSYITAADIPTVDLSSYVSYSYLESKEYITINDIPSVDLSSYVTYSYLANQNYITSSVTELEGPLYITYQQTNNALYGFKSYSHIVAGDENKTTPAFLASKRYCANGVGSYINMASFFVNSDGRAKFAHKASGGGGGDDAFMCFNAYGFKVAFSGTPGVSASTEYDLIHSGNINDYISGGGGSSVVIDENLIPKENNTYTLGDASHLYFRTYTGRISGDNSGLWIDTNTNHRFFAGSTSFRPYSNNQYTLGTDTIRWDSTYSYNYYLGYNTAISSDSDYGVQLTVNGNKNFQFNLYQFAMLNNNYRSQCSLGSSGMQWAYTYTGNLILNGVNATEVFPSYAYVNTVLGDIETLLSNI